MKKCPRCKSEDQLDFDGCLLQCEDCGAIYNEDDLVPIDFSSLTPSGEKRNEHNRNT